MRRLGSIPELAVVGCIVLLVTTSAANAQCFSASFPCCALEGTILSLDPNPPPDWQVSWQVSADGSCPVTYDLSRGDLGAAFLSKSVGFGGETCLLDDVSQTSTPASASLAIGQGVWFLPRTSNASWNEPSPFQPVDRDAPLTSGGFCPL